MQPPIENNAFFKDLVHRLMKAFESRDLSKIKPFVAKDPDIIWFDAAPLKYTGWEAYEAGLREAFRTKFTSQHFTMHDEVMIRCYGDVAFCVCTIHLDVDTAGGGKINADGRWTSIWEKRDSEWLLVHEHLSIPARDSASVDQE